MIQDHFKWDDAIILIKEKGCFFVFSVDFWTS